MSVSQTDTVVSIHDETEQSIIMCRCVRMLLTVFLNQTGAYVWHVILKQAMVDESQQGTNALAAWTNPAAVVEFTVRQKFF